MEILYIWIKKYNDSIIEQGFNFGGEYLFEFKDNVLKCEKNVNYIENFFGESIRNITAIVGENGTGKTSLLDCIIRNLTKNLENIQTQGIFVIKKNNEILIYVHERLSFYEHHSKFILEQILSADKLLDNKLSVKIERFKMINDALGKSNIKGLDFKTSFICFSNVFGKKLMQRNYAYEDLTTVGLIDNYKNKSLGIAMELHFLSELKNQLNFVGDFIESKIISFDIPNEVKVSLVNIEGYKYLFEKLKYKEDTLKELINNTKGKSSKKYKSRFEIILCLILENQLNVTEGEIKYTDHIYDYRKRLIEKLSSNYEKGDTYISNINKLGDVIRRIANDQQRFYNNSIVFNINNNEQKKELDELLDVLIKLEFNEKIFQISWSNLSTGQEAFLNIFSRFYSIKEINKNVVILIDEGEVYLHPKWQREFIMNFTSIIPEILKKKLGDNQIKIQIIITSNTPFLISDLPRENILFLENKNGHCNVKNSKKLEQTFGANIHTLLRDSFFMNNTIGKFAYKKINKVINWLKNVEQEKVNDEYILSPETKEKEILMKRIIENIGEPLIKNKLEKMFYNNFPEYMDKDMQLIKYKNDISKLQDYIKSGIIVDKDELRKLGEELNNTLNQISKIKNSGESK